MKENTTQLIHNFDSYVEVFNSLKLFTGPSIYFHYKTLERLHQFKTPVEAFDDDDFWGEYNYIKPDESIEVAIKKLNKKLKRR